MKGPRANRFPLPPGEGQGEGVKCVLVNFPGCGVTAEA